jgi:HSP20 family protein
MSETIVTNPVQAPLAQSPAQVSGESLPVVRPQFTVRAADGAYEVGVVLPGVKRDDLKLRLEEGVLRIEARRLAGQPEGWRLLRREIQSLAYRLDLQLSVPVDASRISAKLENGMLALRLPLREEAQPREISID